MVASTAHFSSEQQCTIFILPFVCMCKSRQKMLQYFTKEKICSSITNSIILSLSPNLRLIFSIYFRKRYTYMNLCLSLYRKGIMKNSMPKTFSPLNIILIRMLSFTQNPIQVMHNTSPISQ